MDVIASGRDTSGGADVVLRSGLLVGKHDGNSAAYDMKSLGKHIEAVRPHSVIPASGTAVRLSRVVHCIRSL